MNNEEYALIENNLLAARKEFLDREKSPNCFDDIPNLVGDYTTRI